MKTYSLLVGLLICSIGLNAQIRMNSSLAKSALNSNVTKPVVLTSVKNSTPAYSAGMSSNFSANLSSSAGLASSLAVTNLYNNVSSRFGYYTAFYAQLITVSMYSRYYYNVPFAKYLPMVGEYYNQNPTYATRDFNQFWPHYKYFDDGKPGFIPYQNEMPASIFIDIGINKPVPLQVDPASQSYSLINTRFIKTATLTY